MGPFVAGQVGRAMAERVNAGSSRRNARQGAADHDSVAPRGRQPAEGERREDVLPLADRAVERFSQQLGRRLKGLSAGARRTLGRYSWPGNVRELENVIERAVALEQSDVVQAESLDLGPTGSVGGQRRQMASSSSTGGQPVTESAKDRLPETGFALAGC